LFSNGEEIHMRGKISAGVLLTLAFMIPAAPAVAHAEPSGLDAACQTVERKAYQDIRTLVTIDLDTATDEEIEALAKKIEAAARADALPVLPDAVQKGLKGTADELRAFLKKDMQAAWSVGLRISVVRTLTGAGAAVQAAAQKALDNESIDAYLTFLNDGLYAARELDCASQPTASPSVTPSATTSVAPTPTSSAGAETPGETDDDASGGEGGGLPVTGADTGAVAGIGGALLLIGGAGYLIGRRRRSRFVA
jgi:LPXTG-motif cell wall-anchored protein